MGATAGFGPVAGLFSGGVLTVQNITPAGGFGLFQVPVWEAAGGSSYTEAVATGDARWRVGKSAILRVDTGDPTGNPGTPASLVSASLTSFTLTPVPEPGSIALGVLGVGIWLLLRRRIRDSD